MVELFGQFSNVLIFVGFAGVVGFLTLMAIFFFRWLREQIEYLKRRYKDKHQFNRPPIAKCYCIGCEYWRQMYNNDPESGFCENHQWYTADHWFCFDARVRNKETFVKNEQKFGDGKNRFELGNVTVKGKVPDFRSGD